MDLGGLAPIRKLDIGILRQALNTDNLSTEESETKSLSAEHLPKIFRLLASLEDDSQKMLLDSWAKLEIPLNEKTVSQLLQYLGENPASNSEDKMAVIKAFAFLKSNGIPFSEKMVNALRSIFNQNGNLAADLEEYLTNNNSLNQNQIINLLENLDLNNLKNSILNLANLNQDQINQDLLQAGADLSAQNLAEQNNNSSQKSNLKPETNNLNNKILNQQLLNNFNNLDQELKNMILNNLNNLTKNFNQDTIKILNNFLAANNIETAAKKTALLKSFAFLENNQLPLNESLIKEMKNTFQITNLENFIAEIDSKENFLENLSQRDSSLINRNESVLELNSAPAKIAEKLGDFNKISDQIISLFNQIGGENESKIAANFLGQKLVNLQQQEANTPLMLALELPVQLPEKKLASLLLKIEKENQEKSKSQKVEAGYNITFILEFENIGPIQSQINISNNNINTTFFTETAETAELIKNNFFNLKSALNNKGFTINKVQIKNFANLKEEKNQFFNKIILSELNESDQEGKYRHIDLKI